MLIRNAQRHTFGDFTLSPLPFTISSKEDFIFLTQQILFPFPKGKAGKIKPYSHPLTKLYLYLGIWIMLVLNKNFSKT